jgi:hypothetical protein
MALYFLGIKKAGIARFPAFYFWNVFLFLFGLEFFGFLRNFNRSKPETDYALCIHTMQALLSKKVVHFP